jgi:hypothetical protein
MSTSLMTIVPDEKRLIKGERLKFVDGRWSGPDDTPVPERMLVLGCIRAVQCWQDQRVVDCIVQSGTEPLPDVDELNARIPESEWEKSLTNEPKPPWQNVWGLYLCNPQDGSILTFVNSTTGTRIGFEKLKDRIDMMRMLRGASVAPVIKLESRPMKTKFGTKMRPEFTIVNWLTANTDEAPAIEHKPALKPVAEPTTAEFLNDEIPWLG